MRSLPIFLAWVRTWRYRLSRAATPTVNRSVTPTPCVAVCNTASIVPARFPGCAGRRSGPTLCAQPPEKRGRVQVVHEGRLAVDLDHGQPFPVAGLEVGVAADVDLAQLELLLLPQLCERGPGPLAEVARLCVVNGDELQRARQSQERIRKRAEPGFARREPSSGRPVDHAEEGAHGGT